MSAVKLEPYAVDIAEKDTEWRHPLKRQHASRGDGLVNHFEVAEDTPESLLLGVKIERTLVNKDAEASYTIRLRGKFPASPEAEQLQSLVKSRRR